MASRKSRPMRKGTAPVRRSAPKQRSKAEAPAVDMVNHPPHYVRGGVECVDLVEATVTGWSPQTAVRLGQAQQYIFRHAHKGEPVRDLKKAIFWIQREIDALEATTRS